MKNMQVFCSFKCARQKKLFLFFFSEQIILVFGDIITLEVAGFFPLHFEENFQSIGK